MRTFLFTDLRDYTLFIETKGDQVATKMVRASRRVVRDAVAKHRGAEIKTEGDSFYVVFRSPSPAVRCAIDIQRGVAAHNARHPDVPVRMGCGINTGEAIPHDNEYVGSAVVIANRLCMTAAPGQILITDTVRSLVRTGAHAPMRELGAWTLKGVSEPVRVCEVLTETSSALRALGPALPLPAMLASPTRPIPGLVVCPELVGREAPLAALVEHLEAAARGDVRIVAVSGEGGVGKSRLVRELARVAHERGMYVFAGRSHPAGPPYEAVVAALRPYAHARGTEILKRVLGPLAVELRRLLPEVDLGREQIAETEIPADERRVRFLRTIDLLLEDAAAQRPALLVLEDFHDADEASRDVLRSLASNLHAGLCVVVTFREEEVAGAHPLRALLANLDRQRGLARVALAPLDAAGVGRMTAALLPGRNGGALARTVFERSQGIPFYVEELLKTAIDDVSGDIGLALPHSVRDSVQLRIARLIAERGPQAADLLEAAAVAEVPLAYDTLLHLSDRDEDEAGSDVAAAVDAQLLERAPTRSEIYRYRHALTREAVAATIAPARKRRLHARVGEALEKLGDASSRAAMLARHFAAAGGRAKALVYARQGATNAIRVGAYATAIDLLRDAVGFAAGTGEEGRVNEDLGSALQAAGRASEAETVLRRARDLAQDPTTVARIDVSLAAVLAMRGLRADALATVKRAIETLVAAPGPVLAQALAQQARLALAELDIEGTVRISREALNVAQHFGVSTVEIEALGLLGEGSTRLGREEGIRYIEQAIREAHDRRLDAPEVELHLELARALLSRGRNEEAITAARAGIALAHERGLGFLEARLAANATTIAVNLGRYEDARSFAEQAVRIAGPDTVAASQAKMSLGHVISDQGDGEAALAIYDRIREEAERNEPERRLVYWSYRAQALLGLGRLDEAAASARRAVELTLADPGQGMTGFLNAAEICEARGDLQGIVELAREFDEYFAGRDTTPVRIARLEIDAIRHLLEGGDATKDFLAVAEAYVEVGAQVRSIYRRATAAVLRSSVPGDAKAARRDVRALRSELAALGALRYVRAIDLMAKRSPLRPWVVGPSSGAEVVRAN